MTVYKSPTSTPDEKADQFADLCVDLGHRILLPAQQRARDSLRGQCLSFGSNMRVQRQG